jgi:phosphatidate phosphatase APP1
MPETETDSRRARGCQSGRDLLARWVAGAEHTVDRRLVALLRRRPGWSLTVLPYVGYGTAVRAHIRARVLLRRRNPESRTGPAAVLLTAISRYLSVDVPGEAVTVEVSGEEVRAVSGREGYVEATLTMPDLAPGWHPVHFALGGDAASSREGRLVVVDPAASLGVVSDIDDTVIHTGLTRLLEAVRTTLLVAEHARLPIAGAAELYRGLVAGDCGRAQVFYVSTGAWNLHAMLERFLARHDFPAGPLIMTDWGPGGGWLFREDSVSFKARVITELLAEHPHLAWVLVGDSGQDDPAAYAAVARAHPGRIRAIYIRDVPPHTAQHTSRVRRLAAELADRGVPMLLIRDSVAAAEHANDLGLLDADHLDRIRRAAESDADTRRA